MGTDIILGEGLKACDVAKLGIALIIRSYKCFYRLGEGCVHVEVFNDDRLAAWRPLGHPVIVKLEKREE